MDTERLYRITEPLLFWYFANARELPWREPIRAERPASEGRQSASEGDQLISEDEKPVSQGERAYRVWVSEIMLQQTRVEAVKPYYRRFMKSLPDVASLAACQEERLLKLWEGLGYYNRVRNMQKAAQIVMERYGGELPDSYEELLGLPGIGSYTAGAIASIAYGQIVPAVDGNVLRVASRITGSREDISRQAVKRQYETALQDVMERELSGSRENLPGAFNQALMELGAVVCVPGGPPDCAHCPVSHVCRAFETGCQAELPVKASKKARRIEERTVLVIRDGERAAVRRRPGRGLLAGLYELPNEEGRLSADEALDAVRNLGFSPIRITPLPEAKHIFSHIEWRMLGYMVLVEDTDAAEKTPGLADVAERPPIPGSGAARAEDSRDGRILFIEPSRTEEEYPIPAAFAAYTRYLSIRLGQEKYTDTKGETK